VKALALALLVLRNDADNPHNSVALDDLALVADFLDASSYFHFKISYFQLAAGKRVRQAEANCRRKRELYQR
jgi:hypothetical protein